MNISNQKISLRGSLANDIAKHLRSSVYESNMLDILNAVFRSSPDDLMCISDGGMLVVGKKSERGKFKPDW